MIRIKDYIFNENDIDYIYKGDYDLYIYKKVGTRELTISKGSFEDIEWNYENNNEYCNVFYEDRIKELEEENKKLKEQLLNYQMPPHNQKCHWTKPPEITCTTITDGK